VFIFIAGLAIGLIVILLASEFFTNGLEALGQKFSFSQAVLGNLLAAVGTALPETILPIVAVLFGREAAAKEIGIGAILGAPFMISTLAFSLVGIAALLRRKHPRFIAAEAGPIKRDLIFFILIFSSAVFLPAYLKNISTTLISFCLVAAYFCYVWLTIRSDSGALGHFQGLHLFTLQKKLRLTGRGSPQIFLIAAQIIIAVAAMIYGSRLFIQNLQQVSSVFGLDPLLFSLILAPIATELPEKFNSLSWMLKGQDSLALGNLTGALVFQSVFPVSVGLLFTNWQLTPPAFVSAGCSLLSAAIVLAAIVRSNKVRPYVMLISGGLYILYFLILCLNLGI
jgi:cation:H+ antiporter